MTGRKLSSWAQVQAKAESIRERLMSKSNVIGNSQFEELIQFFRSPVCRPFIR